MTAPVDNSVDVFADPTSNPVGYDQALREHKVYSENFKLLGRQPYSVQASLT